MALLKRIALVLSPLILAFSLVQPPAIAATAYFTPTASLSTLAAFGAASPSVANATVTGIGDFSWVSGSCTADGVNWIQATGISTSVGCWKALAIRTPASATTAAGLNIPQGAAPTSPNNGDVWTTSAGLYIRINGTTVGPLGPEYTNLDVFLVGGQSNATGQGDSTDSPVPAAGTAFYYCSGTNTIAPLVDPVGCGATAANTGSAWPSFAIAYYNATGRRVLIVPEAYPSSGQTVASGAHQMAPNWDPADTGSLFYSSITSLNAALAKAVQSGYAPQLKGVLWSQGETDCIAINDSVETQADYQNTFALMIEGYRGEYGEGLPFYIFETGMVGYLPNDTACGLIRESQRNVATAADPHTRLVFWNAVDFQYRGLIQPQVNLYTHYTQAGYNEMGQIGASNVASAQSRAFLQMTNILPGFNQSVYVTAGNLGVGVPVPMSQLHVGSAYRDPASTLGNAFISTTSTPAAGEGPVLSFGGVYDGSSPSTEVQTAWAAISAEKNSSTLGTSGGQISFYVRPDGDVLRRRLTISSGTTGVDGISSFSFNGGTFTTYNLGALDNPFSVGAGNLFGWTKDAAAADKGFRIALGGSYTGTTPTVFGAVGGFKSNGTDGNYDGYLSFYSSENGTGPVEFLRGLPTKAIRLPGYTTPGYLTNDASGNVVSTTDVTATYLNGTGAITTGVGSTRTYAGTIAGGLYPFLMQTTASAPSDEKQWAQFVDEFGVWHLRAYNDATNAGNDALTITRSGTTVSAITFAAQIGLASSTTGAGTQTFTNSPCSGLTTEQWVPVSITGQTGTWYIPACQ